MKKLTLTQIMNLADKLNQTEWITILINLNNNNQIDDFFKMIKHSDILDEILQNTTQKKIR